jgi:hypothetical protein
MSWWVGSAAVLTLAVVLLLGCHGRRTTASGPVDETLKELGEASLSPDESAIAVEGVPGGERTRNRSDHGIWFISTATGKLLYSTPPGWSCTLPVWGPSTSYLMTAMSPNKEWGIYQSESAATAPFLFFSESALGAGHLSPWAYLDSKLRWAVVSAGATDQGSGRTRTVIAYIPLHGGLGATLWRENHYVPLLGVVQDPANPDGGLVLVVGRAEPERDSELLALGCPSGGIRWHSALDRYSGEYGAFYHTRADYDSQHVLIDEEIEDASSELVTKVWIVDTKSGDVHLFGSVPDECRWLKCVSQPKGMPSVYAGTVHDIWQIQSAGRQESRKLVQSTNPYGSAAGIAYDPVHGVEAYMVTTHCVWRCVLKDRTVEILWGKPEKGDEPPRIVDPGQLSSPR